MLDSLSESTNPLESMEGTVNILFNGVRTPVESVCCFGGAALLFTQRGLRLSVAVPRRLLKWPCTIIDVKTSGVAEIDGNIRPGSDGGFELTTEWAGIYTANPGFPRYFPGTDKDHPGRIGFWNQLGTHVEWLLNVPQSGIFEVVIEQACPGGDAGSVYELSIEKPSFMSKTLIVNHETGETVVQAGEAGRKVVLSSFTQPTASWYDYIEVPIGRINLPAGLVKVELRPINLKRGAFMDVRNVRMKTLRL